MDICNPGRSHPARYAVGGEAMSGCDESFELCEPLREDDRRVTSAARCQPATSAVCFTERERNDTLCFVTLEHCKWMRAFRQKAGLTVSAVGRAPCAHDEPT